MLLQAAKLRIRYSIRNRDCVHRVGNALYHYDSSVYGFRQLPVPEIPKYSTSEIKNRSTNSNLLRYVEEYRRHGHKLANLDPLGLQKINIIPELNTDNFGFTNNSEVLDTTGIVYGSLPKQSFGDIKQFLEKTYSGYIGAEFSHLSSIGEREWFSQEMETLQKKGYSGDEKLRFMELMSRAEVFDHFLAKRFPGVKRYGLEGAEAMLIALDTLFKSSNHAGATDIVIGMAHRGRLNLLTDLLKFDTTILFHKLKGKAEFNEKEVHQDIVGDVISHLFVSTTLNYGAPEPLNVSFLPNPSHLEAVNPVAVGKTRAKQCHIENMQSKSLDENSIPGDKALCLQIHGDAAFSGQGVVMETLAMGNLPHFTTGGSIHLIVNNQVGFTTPSFNGRSTAYASDVAKMINAPIVHVNGDKPEEVAKAMELVHGYRQKFRKDVVLDLITYRRWGHNELDEPRFTNPKMYDVITPKKSLPKQYEEQLISENITNSDAIYNLREKYQVNLDQILKNSEKFVPQFDHLEKKWAGKVHPKMTGEVTVTGVEEAILKNVGLKSVDIPKDVQVHPRLERTFIQPRKNRINSGNNIDWATAEALAFGSLLLEGSGVRISGQDVGRGTFSQRHIMVVDQKSGNVFQPLNCIDEHQAKLEVANSHLSELAVLGFEYGMSIEDPNKLFIWEAQFGDFFNQAQVTIDTFITSGEAKWLRQSGLVMMLPHGYIGAGPEHSSCRIERFLQCSNVPYDVVEFGNNYSPNFHFVNCTTPAQYFHVLRRQIKRNYRKPLIIATPKTLLRLPSAVSDLSEMGEGTSFQSVLQDKSIQDPSSVYRVLFVSGQIYYDLVKQREQSGFQDKLALIRVEELCPFPTQRLMEEISKYSKAREFVWCQEEPRNMGAYSFMAPRLQTILPKGRKLHYVGRMESAVPATGVVKNHHSEQREILHQAVSPFAKKQQATEQKKEQALSASC